MPCSPAAPFSEQRIWHPPIGFEGAPGCGVTERSIWTLDAWAFAVYVAHRGIGWRPVRGYYRPDDGR